MEDMDQRGAVRNEAGLAADEALLRSMKRPPTFAKASVDKAGMKRRL